MPRSWLTLGFCLSFLAAAFALQWWQQPVYPGWVWILLGIVGFLGFIGLFWVSTYAGAALLLSCTLGISLALLRVAQTTHISTPATVDTYAKSQVATLQGTIADLPDRRPLSTRYVVAVERLAVASGEGREVHGRVLVIDYEAWPLHAYGDEVRVRGTLERPRPIVGSTSSPQAGFAYDRYLSRFGVTAVVRRAKVETLSTGHGSRVLAPLYRVREATEARINRIYPEPHAALLAGLLLGSRRGMPEQLQRVFQRTGLSHIVAISGANITMVLSILSALLFFVPARGRALLLVLSIIGYTVIAGATASVVRAAIMGILGVVALEVGRQRHTLIAIGVAAVLMVGWNPKVLWFDPSFQLSFLAVLGLSLLSPHLERWLKSVPRTLGVREALTMTIAAQLFAVPLVVVLFGELSLVSPLANVLVAPVLPFAMLIGVLGLGISVVWFPLGQFVSLSAWGLLEVVLWFAERCASLPFAAVRVAHPSAWVVGGYYTVLVAVLFHFHLRRSAPQSP